MCLDWHSDVLPRFEGAVKNYLHFLLFFILFGLLQNSQTVILTLRTGGSHFFFLFLP
jgi:hypothetical protein